MADLWVATRDHLTRSDEPEPNRRVYGDLRGDTVVQLRRGVEFVLFGRRGGDQSRGVIRIDNASGRHDHLLLRDMRDQPVEILRYSYTDTYDRPPLASAERLATMIVEGVSAPSPDLIEISLRSPLARWDRPLQADVYDDGAPDHLRGRPKPILLGLARNIRAVLAVEGGKTESDYTYHLTDPLLPLSGIAVVRDGGLPFDTLQWSFTPDATGFELHNHPYRVVTADASTSGDAVDIPPAPDDELGGEGDFEAAWSYPDMPPAFPVEDQSTTDFGGGVFRLTRASAGYSGGGHCCRLAAPSRQGDWRSMRTDHNPLQPGTTYRLAYTVLGRGGGIPELGELPRLRIRAMPSGQVLADITSAVPDGAFSANVHIAAGTAQDLEFRVDGAAARFDLDDVSIFALVSAPEITLEPITLTDALRHLIEVRGGEPASAWDEPSAAAVDPVGRGFGDWVGEPITLAGQIRRILDTFIADVYPGRDGRARFAAWSDPRESSSEDIVWEIDAGNRTQGATVAIAIEPAAGLTTRALARLNHHAFSDGDFNDAVDDLDDSPQVPQSIRESYRRRGQIEVTLPVRSMPAHYRHAEKAAPLELLFDERADAEAVLAQAVEPFRRGLLYRVVVHVVGAPLLDPWQAVRFRWPRYGFAAGAKMRILTVEEDIDGNGFVLTRLHLIGAPRFAPEEDIT